MQQEDDLRGLAKVMEFMRAVSILFVVVHVYWYCCGAMERLNADIEVVGKILVNFDRTAGLFGSPLTTKVFAVIFLALSCLGTRGVKNEKVTWEKIYAALIAGLVFFFMNWWLLSLPVDPVSVLGLYTLTLAAGYIHAQIVVDNARVAAETRAYEPIPVINDFLDAGGNDIMREQIQYNYDKVKVDVMDIIEEELERIKNDPNLRHLLGERDEEDE